MWEAPLLFGHRGAPGAGHKENTLTSFEQAMLDGARALETDAHLTADGHVVLSHDHDLQRVFGVDLEIRKHTLAEVQARAPVPTLAEVLARFPAVPLNVDLKQRTPPIESAVVDVVRAAHASDRVLLASFHADVLRRVRGMGYEGKTGLGRDEVARLLMLPTAALKLWRLRGARAQVPRASGSFRFDTRAFIDKCHALDIAVDFWTINDVEEARELLALGADGIMSDVPGEVAAAFAPMSGTGPASSPTDTAVSADPRSSA